MIKNINANDLFKNSLVQDIKIKGSEVEEVIVQCEQVPSAEKEILINSILTEFSNFSFDSKINALKILYLDGYTNFDPFHTLDEKNVFKAIDEVSDILLWELETVGFYVELERSFKQEFALRKEEENSSSFGMQMLILFLTQLLETFAQVQKEKATEKTNEVQSVLEQLQYDLSEGKYDNVVSLMKDMQESTKTNF